MSAEILSQHAREAVWLLLAISLPVLLVGSVVGLLVAAFQASSQLQDPTVQHLPRLLAVLVALAVLGPWMASEVATYAKSTFLAAALPP